MIAKKGLQYTENHEWLKQEGRMVRIGITDFAQEKLGDVVFVELPAVDDQVTKEDPFTVVESVKAVSDVFSPVSGVIVAINETLEDSPELINEDPYDQGWIVEVEPIDEFSFEGLMSPEEYQAYIEEE